MSDASFSTPFARRGAVAVLVALSLFVIFAFGAMAVDLSDMTATENQLQRAADAAALAAASQLTAANTAAESQQISTDAAADAASRNPAARESLDLGGSDIEFGSFTVDAVSGAASFVTTFAGLPSAVRVTTRREDMSLFLAPVIGQNTKTLTATAAAALMPRDIAVVIDLSGSMKADSYLRFYDVTQINARDIWCALDGPEPSRPYFPGDEFSTEYAGDTGPVIGAMSEWGDPIYPGGAYDPTSDPGLWNIPQDAGCTEPGITASLTSRGYSGAQINALMGDNDEWTNRVAVMIGLAEWSDDSDLRVESGELTWSLVDPHSIQPASRTFPRCRMSTTPMLCV